MFHSYLSVWIHLKIEAKWCFTSQKENVSIFTRQPPICSCSIDSINGIHAIRAYMCVYYLTAIWINESRLIEQLVNLDHKPLNFSTKYRKGINVKLNKQLWTICNSSANRDCLLYCTNWIDHSLNRYFNWTEFLCSVSIIVQLTHKLLLFSVYLFPFNLFDGWWRQTTATNVYYAY